MKKFSILGQEYELAAFVIVSCCILTLIYLGTWQLQRRSEKLNFISKIQQNIINPPITLDSLKLASSYDIQSTVSKSGIKLNKDTYDNANTIQFYSKVKLEGHFLNDQNTFLYGRRSAYPEKDGYYFISPFQDITGNIYLVSRAWIPQHSKKNAESFISRNNESIIAFVMPGEKKSFFTPDNDLKNNIWFTLDLQQAEQKFHLTNKDFYLMQVDSGNLPEGAHPLVTKYLNVVRNDHLEYAITWYSLAGFLSLIYYIFNKKRLVGNNIVN